MDLALVSVKASVRTNYICKTLNSSIQKSQEYNSKWCTLYKTNSIYISTNINQPYSTCKMKLSLQFMPYAPQIYTLIVHGLFTEIRVSFCKFKPITSMHYNQHTIWASMRPYRSINWFHKNTLYPYSKVNIKWLHKIFNQLRINHLILNKNIIVLHGFTNNITIFIFNYQNLLGFSHATDHKHSQFGHWSSIELPPLWNLWP